MRISDWSSDVCSSDLGRGKVLRAFDGQDETALGRFGQEKLAWIERETTRRNAELYVDVSKHFIHGLHLPFVRALPDLGIVLLVRDPILNLRSYLNRQKDFWLDNNRPDSVANQLRLERSEEHKSELQSLMHISYTVFCLKKKNKNTSTNKNTY